MISYLFCRKGIASSALEGHSRLLMYTPRQGAAAASQPAPRLASALAAHAHQGGPWRHRRPAAVAAGMTQCALLHTVAPPAARP